MDEASKVWGRGIEPFGWNKSELTQQSGLCVVLKVKRVKQRTQVFQQKAKVQDGPVQHFPNSRYSALTFQDDRCSVAVGRRLGFTIVCSFVPAMARWRSLWSSSCPPWPLLTGTMVWAQHWQLRNFSVGCSTLKKEAYEKRKLKCKYELFRLLKYYSE